MEPRRAGVHLEYAHLGAGVDELGRCHPEAGIPKHAGELKVRELLFGEVGGHLDHRVARDVLVPPERPVREPHPRDQGVLTGLHVPETKVPVLVHEPLGHYGARLGDHSAVVEHGRHRITRRGLAPPEWVTTERCPIGWAIAPRPSPAPWRVARRGGDIS